MRLKSISKFLVRATADRRGVTAAEYAILAVGIVIVVGTAVTLLKDPVNSAFGRMGTTLTNSINNFGSAR